MSDKFQALAKLGAGDFDHLDGSLIEHLNGTKDLLQQWGRQLNYKMLASIMLHMARRGLAKTSYLPIKETK